MEAEVEPRKKSSENYVEDKALEQDEVNPRPERGRDLDSLLERIEAHRIGLIRVRDELISDGETSAVPAQLMDDAIGTLLDAADELKKSSSTGEPPQRTEEEWRAIEAKLDASGYPGDQVVDRLVQEQSLDQYSEDTRRKVLALVDQWERNGYGDLPDNDEPIWRDDSDMALVLAAVRHGFVRYNEETGLAERCSIRREDIDPKDAARGNPEDHELIDPFAATEDEYRKTVLLDNVAYALRNAEMQRHALTALGVKLELAGRGHTQCARVAQQFALYGQGLATPKVRELVEPIADKLARDAEDLSPKTAQWVGPLREIFKPKPDLQSLTRMADGTISIVCGLSWDWAPLKAAMNESSPTRRVLAMLAADLGPRLYKMTPFFRLAEDQIKRADRWLEDNPYKAKGDGGGPPLTPYGAAERFASLLGVTMPRQRDSRRLGKD